uniref:Uncharacterized protein n=1 Tax=Macaca mulatta TaxID=9544 RepID=A0A5F7ZKV2_MACMU
GGRGAAHRGRPRSGPVMATVVAASVRGIRAGQAASGSEAGATHWCRSLVLATWEAEEVEQRCCDTHPQLLPSHGLATQEAPVPLQQPWNGRRWGGQIPQSLPLLVVSPLGRIGPLCCTQGLSRAAG